MLAHLKISQCYIPNGKMDFRSIENNIYWILCFLVSVETNMLCTYDYQSFDLLLIGQNTHIVSVFFVVFHVLSSVTLNWEFLSLFEGFPRNINFWHWIPLASLCRGGKKFRGPKVAPEITFGRGTASTVQRSHAKINCTLTI